MAKTGNCRCRSWLTAGDQPLPEPDRDEIDHGVMPWAVFITAREAEGATRATFDLFDVPQPNGLWRRYRVVDEEFTP